MGAPGQPAAAGAQLTDAILGAAEVALFDNLYAAYHLDALRLATSILGGPEQAEDAAHTAFLEMLRYVLSGRRWHDPGDAKAAVLRNTRWAAMKIVRARSRRGAVRDVASIQPGLAATDDDWARFEMRALCEEIVGRLRDRDRRAIRLHFVESLSHAEAGARMGISGTAFQSQLARALAAARRSARALGAASVVAWLPPIHLPTIRLRAARGLAARLVVSAAAGVAVGVPAAVAVAAAAHRDTPAAPAAAAIRPAAVAMRPAAALDGIGNAVLVDMISLAPRQPAVLALGKGGRCTCWIVFRSDDGGASWREQPGPAEVPAHPRLAVAATFPVDPRIFVTDGSTGSAAFQAATFGRPFTVVDSSLPPLLQVRREGLAQQVGTEAGGSLRVDQGWCSLDGGRTWQRSCATSSP